MLDVTYIGPVNYNAYDLSSDYISYRVMYSILKKQTNINVTYSDLPVTSKIFCCLKKSFTDAELINFYKKEIQKIQTDYVLFTGVGLFHVILIIELLKRGKKVVVGGPLTKIFTCNELRDFFKDYTDDYSLLENIMIVKPYIGPDFDFYNSIKEWKDIEDGTYDFKDMFYSEDDLFLNQITMLNDNRVSISCLQVVLNIDCLWGKCEFCSQRHKANVKFIDWIDPDRFTDSIIKLTRKHNIKVVKFADPIITLDKKTIKIFSNLKKAGLKIITYTYLPMLKNDKYFNTATELIDVIMIGVETMSDFQLKQINKGYTYKDIKEVFNKIVKVKPKCRFVVLLISDLPSHSEKDVLENFNRIAHWKLKFNENSIKHSIKLPQFQVFYGASIINNPYIKILNKDNIHFMEYQRIDYKNEVLKSDKEIVHPVIYNFVNENKLHESNIAYQLKKVINDE